MLEIRLLGPLEVRDGEQDLTPRRRKQRALLAALALRVGEPASPDRLVDELWGENPPRTARHALENYVSELRRALGGDVIATRPAGYVLDVDPEHVDVARFERLVASSAQRPPTERAEQLRDALSLVRGAPLADLAFEPFASPEAARLGELELRAREALVETEIGLGHHADAVLTLERLVASHPLRERLRALLMLALYRSGRQAEALAVYQDIRRTLLDELGIDPGDDLRELERAILRQDSELRAPPSRSDLARATGRGIASTTAEPTLRPMRKTVSVLFAELANAGTLADRLDPEPLRVVLDRYLDAVRAAVEGHGGTSHPLAGTAVVAVFGIPLAHEDDALRAVRAAVNMRSRVGVLNDGLLLEHGVFIEARAAVNTGEALVGTTGGDLATGRTVSVAEQLGSAAAPGHIVLGEATRVLVRDAVETEPLPTGPGGASGHRLVELRPDVRGRALRLDSPLVGRRRQLAALATAFETTVAEGSSHLVTLLGAAGVGKSRLILEFLETLGDVAEALRGRCLPYGERIPYWPLVEAVREAGGALDATSTDTVLHAFRELAHGRPLVLVLDDLQWADGALLDLVGELVATPSAVPLLVLCTARPELRDDYPAWGEGVAHASSVLLEPLTEAESERLVDNLLGDSELADPVRDHIVDSAEGNPLFLEELLATLVEREVLTRDAGRWTTTELPAIPLPPTIQALVAARLDRLPPDEREVLELASVDGTRFGRTAVSELAPRKLRGEVEDLLTALVRKEIVRGKGGEDLLSIRHQVIRDTAYGSMPIQRRAALHERMAQWLTSTSSEDERVRYHLELAERYRSELGGSSTTQV